MKIEKELVAIGLEADSKEEALKVLGEQLLAIGAVKEGFVESILQREIVFPTGLPTVPFGVAIPHTDGDMVNESRIAFASLKKPVEFLMMGKSDELVEVKLIFMLALKTPEDQLEMLQKLVGMFQNPDTVAKLAESKDINALNNLLSDNST